MRTLFVALVAVMIILSLAIVAFAQDGAAPGRVTMAVCLGDPANCSPLVIATSSPTDWQCPPEWCPYPPMGVRCHCPIQYTLIAPIPEEEIGQLYIALLEIVREFLGQ
jgi:hypothetical protein